MLSDVLRRPYYYYKKLAVRVENRYSRYRRNGGAVLTNALPSIRAYDRIVFFLDNRFSHVGDQIFFKPLVTHLSRLGCAVTVHATPQIRFFFKTFSVEAEASVRGLRTLVVSKQEAREDIARIFGPSSHWFLFQLRQNTITTPISNFLLSTFRDYFRIPDLSLEVNAASYLDGTLIHPPAHLDQLKGQPLVVYNDYVDSGKWRIWGLQKALLNRLRMEKKEGEVVVLLGSAQDKATDSRDFSCVADVDLRGQTSFEDIFAIFQSCSIRRVYCCDTAILHIATLYDVPATVAFRRFFGFRESAQKHRAFLSMFSKPLSRTTVLN